MNSSNDWTNIVIQFIYLVASFLLTSSTFSMNQERINLNALIIINKNTLLVHFIFYKYEHRQRNTQNKSSSNEQQTERKRKQRSKPIFQQQVKERTAGQKESCRLIFIQFSAFLPHKKYIFPHAKIRMRARIGMGLDVCARAHVSQPAK